MSMWTVRFGLAVPVRVGVVEDTTDRLVGLVMVGGQKPPSVMAQLLGGLVSVLRAVSLQ